MHFVRFQLALALLGLRVACGHGSDAGTWNELHITPATQTLFFYPYDGRAPKIAVLLHNHDDDADSPPIIISAIRVNGQPIDLGVGVSGAGPLVIAPNDVALPSLSAAGVFDGTWGPPLAIGETRSYHIEFDFTVAPGATPKDPLAPAVSTLAQDVQFTNLGDVPVLGGPNTFSGFLRVPPLPAGAVVANPRVEVASPQSGWIPLTLTAVAGSNGTAFSFSQALPTRNDLYLRYSADGYDSRVLWLGFSNAPPPPLDLTLTPSAPIDLDYALVRAIATSTGFWRGAASDSERTFVAFPGQANWKSTASDAEARALRASGRIVKYQYDGTKLWDYAPGWETWGGDMTADGRYVAFALNPIAQRFYTPTQNQLVLLDGATGAVIWTKSAPADDPTIGAALASIEVRFSPDAKWIAVGSIGTGRVSLLARATGDLIWSAPSDPAGFGEVDRLCFSPDSQFVYCGSREGHLRKLAVPDGAQVWSQLVYDGPYVNGLSVTADGLWLAAGTKSGDASILRADNGALLWQSTTEANEAALGPDARFVVTDSGQVYNAWNGTFCGSSHTTGVAQFAPDGRSFLQLGKSFQCFDLGGKLLKTFAAPGLGSGAVDGPQWVHISGDGNCVVALARDLTDSPQTGIVIYQRRGGQNTSAAPAVSMPPLSQSVTHGTVATLCVGATGTAPLAYRWQRDGVDVVGASGASLILPEAGVTTGGAYTVTVSNAAGAVVSAPAVLNVVGLDPSNPPRIVNLSARATVGTEPLTVGFAVGGAGTSGTTPLLIRGTGPALVPFGVSNPLTDPVLTLFSGTTSVTSNDNWGGDPSITALSAQVGAFALTNPASKDAAIPFTTAAGSFSVQLSTGDHTSGDALAEVYDATTGFAANTPRLVNISARNNSGPAHPLTAGFVIEGPAAKTILIRGVGPGLMQFDVSGVLADPVLTVFHDKTPIATNDNWYDAPNALQIATAAAATGAFALDPASRDAALVISLPPGAYTAQVAGAGGTSGEALVEVYEVP